MPYLSISTQNIPYLVFYGHFSRKHNSGDSDLVHTHPKFSVAPKSLTFKAKNQLKKRLFLRFSLKKKLQTEKEREKKKMMMMRNEKKKRKKGRNQLKQYLYYYRCTLRSWRLQPETRTEKYGGHRKIHIMLRHKC
jgi:hypothetical protein